jgi:serine/threonine protein kinase
MTQASCLRREQIEAYLLGDIDDEQMAVVDAHLAACPHCQAVADEVESSSDELVDLVKQPRPHSEFADEEECQRLLDRGKAIPGDKRGQDRGTLKRLGEYAIVQHIGGNMGDVYKAVHTKMDRTVVLKVLPSSLWSDKQSVARFEREMKAMGNLEHPHIARAYDAREIDGRHVLVMEYVPGPSLHELLKRSDRLPIADACEIAGQAAEGLAYVHRQGLVHRDVKPSNLMLTPEGQVKLLDWGLARFRTPRPDDEDLTGSACVLGTPHYMAPEQVTASHDVDVRADIYGLGCTLYHLLAGRAPFDNSKYQGRREIMTARLRDPIPPIQESRPDVPDALASVLDRMLARNPDDRFGNAAEVAAALKPFAAGADLRALATGRQQNNKAAPS